MKLLSTSGLILSLSLFSPVQGDSSSVDFLSEDWKRKRCSGKNRFCLKSSACCDGLKCMSLKCKEVAKMGEKCMRSEQCTGGLKCQDAGLGGVCIPDVTDCLHKSKMDLEKVGGMSVKDAFMSQIKLVKESKKLFKDDSVPDMGQLAKLMCQFSDTVLGMETVLGDAIGNFNMCVDSENRAPIIRTGVVGSSGLEGFRGTLGGGYIFDSKNGELGCYAVACLEMGVDIEVAGKYGSSAGIDYAQNLQSLKGSSYKSFGGQVGKEIKSYSVQLKMKKSKMGLDLTTGTANSERTSSRGLCKTFVAPFEETEHVEVVDIQLYIPKMGSDNQTAYVSDFGVVIVLELVRLQSVLGEERQIKLSEEDTSEEETQVRND